MTKILPLLLNAAEHAGASDRKELANKVPARLMYEYADGTRKPVRELLHTDSTTDTTLIQAEVYRTIIEGSNPAKAMRESLDIIQLNTRDLRVNYGTAGRYAPEITEGAEIPIHVQGYTPVSYVSKKYGARPVISRELVDDALFDIINDEIKYAGAACENSLNHFSIGALLEGSGNETDRAGSNLGIKAIAAAMGVSKEAGWIPTDVIMHPEAESLVLQDNIAVTANYQTHHNADMTGNLSVIMGLGSHSVGTTTSSTTYTWGYAANGEMGMLIYDRTSAAKIGMREDLRVEQYADPIKDLVGMAVTMRFDTQSVQSTGATRVEY